MGCTTDRELHPAPKVCIWLLEIIQHKPGFLENLVYVPLLRLDDALDRADRGALRRIVMTDAFDAGGRVNHVEHAVAFADGIGGTLGQARAAGDAVFVDFHCHEKFSNFKMCRLD